MLSDTPLWVAALRAGLSGYHDVLRGSPVHLYGPFRERVLRDGGAVVAESHWLQVMGFGASDKLFRLAEAVRLLQLLARVDAAAYYEELAAVWARVAHEEPFGRPHEDEELPIERRVGIQCSLWKRLSSCKEQLTLWKKCIEEPQAPSAQYDAVCASVGDESLRHVAVPVRLVINCHELYGTELFDRLPMVEALVLRQHALQQEAAASPERVRVAITELSLDGVLYNMPVDSVVRIAQCGVRVSDIGVLYMRPVTSALHPERHRIRDAAMSLLGIGQPRHAGTSAMVFVDSSMANMVVPVFSALLHAQWLEKLTICLKFGKSDADELWSWIAYALFSPHARHGIMELRIDLDDVVEADLVALKEVLQASNPLQAVRGLSEECDDASGRVVAKRFFLSQRSESSSDDSAGTAQHVFESPNPLDVQVLRGFNAEAGNLKVLLPGWGVAWVAQDDVTARRIDRGHGLAHTPGRAIPNLVITSLSENSSEAALQFLSRIGVGIRSVVIESFEGSRSLDAFLRRLFAVCPHIRTLVIPSAPVKSLKTLVDHARGLHHLKVGKQLGVRTCHFMAMLEAVNDPRHPFAKRMESLSLRVAIRQRADLATIVSQLATLLASGGGLCSLRLFFRVTCPIDKTQDVDPALMKYCSDPPVVRVGPMALSKKLAFLSAICHHTQAHSALSRLDSGVISTILQFGARFQKRQVEITFQ